MFKRLLQIFVTLAALLLAGPTMAAQLSPGAEILSRLGMGKTLSDGIVAGMAQDLARQGWSPFRVAQAGNTARKVIESRLPPLLEQLASILFHDLPPGDVRTELEAARSGAYDTGFSELESFWRHVLYLWKLQTADGVAQVAHDRGLTFTPLPQPPVDRPEFPPVPNARPDAAQRYWQACYVATTNVDTLASQYMDRIRATNPAATRVQLAQAETEIRAIFAEMMAKMEPLIIRGLSESLPPRQLDRIAQWCRRPVGEAITSTPVSALQPAIDTWMLSVIPEIKSRIAGG